jgi:hypothetical protein
MGHVERQEESALSYAMFVSLVVPSGVPSLLHSSLL